MKKTKFFNNEQRNWLLIDARDKILGRLATQIAKILQGKNKPTYSPNFLCGDKVVVINAEQIKVTANKLDSKTSYQDSTAERTPKPTHSSRTHRRPRRRGTRPRSRGS